MHELNTKENKKMLVQFYVGPSKRDEKRKQKVSGDQRCSIGYHSHSDKMMQV